MWVLKVQRSLCTHHLHYPKKPETSGLTKGTYAKSQKQVASGSGELPLPSAQSSLLRLRKGKDDKKLLGKDSGELFAQQYTVGIVCTGNRSICQLLPTTIVSTTHSQGCACAIKSPAGQHRQIMQGEPSSQGQPYPSMAGPTLKPCIVSCAALPSNIVKEEIVSEIP